MAEKFQSGRNICRGMFPNNNEEDSGMVDLDKIVKVGLKVGECVLLRNALRMYVERKHGDVMDALNRYECSAAFIHEQEIADAVGIFAKLCATEEVL